MISVRFLGRSSAAMLAAPKLAGGDQCHGSAPGPLDRLFDHLFRHPRAPMCIQHLLKLKVEEIGDIERTPQSSTPPGKSVSRGASPRENAAAKSRSTLAMASPTSGSRTVISSAIAACASKDAAALAKVIAPLFTS
jgi:hypothetical protein